MPDFLDTKKLLPNLGIGLGLRRELAAETLESRSKIDWLELVPENYMGLGGACRERLESARNKFPLVTHGINLSIGSTDDLNVEYLSKLKKLLDLVDAPWFSDHLCFTSCDGIYMHDLLPVPRSKEAIKLIAEKIKRVQGTIGRPFLLENISYYMNVPGCEMNDSQFLAEVAESADCGLLLDVNNVYVNSLNHDFDPFQYLNQIPLERTVQIHVAGHKQGSEYVIDTHGSAVIEPVFELLQYVLERVEVKGVMLERDQNFPEFDEILSEVDRIRAVSDAASELRLSGSAPRAASPVKHFDRKSKAPGNKDLAEVKHARVLSA
ncbi:MAG TPA: DUF692 domain-containing protein [Candidatus Melainabacteria bacterium]|nr:DUF692 domain-containing protein [Candidatus Melainabacteria bacterium]